MGHIYKGHKMSGIWSTSHTIAHGVTDLHLSQNGKWEAADLLGTILYIIKSKTGHVFRVSLVLINAND